MPKQSIDLTKVSINNVKNDAVGSMGIAPYQETTGEEYMNDKQLAHIEKILLAWRQSLMEEVNPRPRAKTH